MSALPRSLARGFADPVVDAQAGFRALLDAMARPGTIHAAPEMPVPPAPLLPAAAAVLLTLADADTPVWTDAGPAAVAWLRFHAGAPFAALHAAAFVLATAMPPALAGLAQGTDEAPHESATLIIQCVALTAGRGWRLTGPGIETEHRLAVAGLPPDFAAQWAANHARAPMGVDVIFCAGSRLAALPRSTIIEAG